MNIDLPQKIMIEKNIESVMDSALSEMKLGKKCLIVVDPNLVDIGKKIRSALTAFSIKMVAPNSLEIDFLKKLSDVIAGFDFTIAVGGGKTIDAAKYASFLAKKPWVAFPTILSHDGIVSSRAVINSDGEKTSIAASEPTAIFADLDILKNAPYRHTAGGAGDCLANISAVEDWKLAAKAGMEEYSTLLGELALLSAKAVINHAIEIKARSEHGLEILLWSLICSGFAMNIHGSSRPASGSEHNFSHALDMITSNINFEKQAKDKITSEANIITRSEASSNIQEQSPKPLHGEQCALGAMIMSYLQSGGGFFSNSRSDFGWGKIRDVMKRLGLPTTASEIGLSKDVLIRALVEAKNVRERYTILNEKNLTEREAEKILKKLGVI